MLTRKFIGRLPELITLLLLMSFIPVREVGAVKCLICDGVIDETCNVRPYVPQMTHKSQKDCDEECYSYHFDDEGRSILLRLCGKYDPATHPEFAKYPPTVPYLCSHYDYCNEQFIEAGDLRLPIVKSGSYLQTPFIYSVLLSISIFYVFVFL